MDHWDVAVVGAGPAGLTAACRAAMRGFSTLVLEKNRKPGVKILISGGGHCNLTHATDARGIVKAFGAGGRFLHSALAAFSPNDLVQLMAAEGVPTTVLPGGKVLPASGRATDVLAAVMRRVRASGAVLATQDPLVEINRTGTGFRLVTTTRCLTASRVVLCVGGCSYPKCGTSGDGYRWAAQLGHTIVTPRPALVPILTNAAWVKELQGVTIPDVLLQVIGQNDDGGVAGSKRNRRSPLTERRGSLLFAHFGLTGPVALDVSRFVSGRPAEQRPVVVCDFLPDVKQQQLEALLADGAMRFGRRHVAALLDPHLPRRLAEALVGEAGIPAERRAAELARHERMRLVEAVKAISIPALGTLGFAKAEVTAGGVDLKEIDSRTMESKRVPGLFLAGELLDLDGLIGGYNLQAAFSTGFLAGEAL